MTNGGLRMTFLKGRTFYLTTPDTGRRVPVVWLHQDDTGWVARWEIHDNSQRMHKYPAIPKDAKVWQDIIEPVCYLIQVLDRTENVVYTISVDGFRQHKWLLTTKAGPQWAVDRDCWAQEQYAKETWGDGESAKATAPHNSGYSSSLAPGL